MFSFHNRREKVEGLFNEARHDQEAAHKGEFVQGIIAFLCHIKVPLFVTYHAFKILRWFIYFKIPELVLEPVSSVMFCFEVVGTTRKEIPTTPKVTIMMEMVITQRQYFFGLSCNTILSSFAFGMQCAFNVFLFFYRYLAV